MRYYGVVCCFVYTFVVCSSKEVEIDAVVQLDQQAVRKLLALIQNPNNGNNDKNSKKRYVDYLKEAIIVMKSYNNATLSDLFETITDSIKDMFEKEDVTNSEIMKELDKVKHETTDDLRRKLLDNALSALDDKSEAGARRLNEIENATKDFNTRDISSFVTNLKMLKHGTKRRYTKSHNFKNNMNKMIQATMFILNCLKEEKAKSEKPKTSKSHRPRKYKPTFEEQFDYHDREEGLKTKLDHDYFVLDEPLGELTQENNEYNPLRKRPKAPAVSISIEKSFDSTGKRKKLKKGLVADFDIEVEKNKKLPFAKNKRGRTAQKDDDDEKESSELLRQLYPPEMKSMNVKIVKEEHKKAIRNDEDEENATSELKRAKDREQQGSNNNKASELLRQIFPSDLIGADVKVIKQTKDDDNNDAGKEKISQEYIEEKSKKQKVPETSSELARWKAKKQNIDEQEKASSETIGEKIKNQKVADLDKTSSESIKGRVKKSKSMLSKRKPRKQKNYDDEKISTELVEKKAKKQNIADDDGEESSELIKAEKQTSSETIHRIAKMQNAAEDENPSSESITGKAVKQKNSDVERTSEEVNSGKAIIKQKHTDNEGHNQGDDDDNEKLSSELLSQIFPTQIKNMSVKIVQQENGMPQEIRVEHDATIDVTNFRNQQAHQPENNAPTKSTSEAFVR